jgi:hypothetical protein
LKLQRVEDFVREIICEEREMKKKGEGGGRREEYEVESVDEDEGASIAVTAHDGTINLMKLHKLHSGRIRREVEKKGER